LFRSWQFLHSFPYDEFAFDLPISFESPVILENISIIGSSDFDCSVSVSSLPLSFSRKGDVYRSRIADAEIDARRSPIRVTMSRGEPVTLRARFRRSAYKRYGLIVTPLFLAVVVGMGVGVVSRKSGKWPKTIARIFPITGALTSPWVLRGTVLDRYPDLPRLIQFEGITIFEVVVILSWIVMTLLIA